MRILSGKLLLSLLLVTALGCGSKDERTTPNTYKVTGTVNLNGKPLEKGEIRFESPKDAEQGLSPASGIIENGKYEVESRAGKYTVRISSIEEYGQADETGVKPTREKILPKYNTQSTLEAEVKAEGENSIPFDLKS